MVTHLSKTPVLEIFNDLDLVLVLQLSASEIEREKEHSRGPAAAVEAHGQGSQSLNGILRIRYQTLVDSWHGDIGLINSEKVAWAS